jgi:hypothetical protein
MNRNTTRRILLLATALLVIGAMGAPAQDFRNIASFQVDTYFDGEFETTLDEVFLARLTDLVTLETKIEQRSGSGNGLTFLYLGPIFTWAPGFYTISRYGIGYRSDGVLGHEVELQANYESPDFFVGGGVRGRAFPDDDVWYVIPSLGGKIFPAQGWGLFGKYFFSYNSSDQVSHAFWSEVDYAVADRVTLKVGGTTEIGEDPIDPDSAEVSYSVLSGATFRASDTVNIRYHLEYLGRVDYADGLRNLILVDWRF